MIHILITSSLLILLVLLIRWLLRGKVPHWLIYAAWGLVALRLLIPVQFGQWQYSIATVTEQVQEKLEPEIQITQPVIDQPQTEPYDPLPTTSIQPDTPTIPEPAPLPQKTAPTLRQILQWVWIAGAAGMAMWFGITNWIFLRRAKRDSTPYAHRVRISPNVPTPCLAGLIRPVIYLTPASTENPQSLHHVLIHEQTHLRHADHVWSLVRCVCLCTYWFHPLVWVAAICSRRDCELACDEGALKKLGDEERIAYGKTLVDTVSSTGAAHLLNTATAMNESKKQLKERVKFIVKKPRNIIIAAICMVLIGVIAAGCAFAGAKKQASVDADTPFELQFEPERKDLPGLESAEQIKPDMTLEEVCEIMGNPQRDVGIGMTILEWDLSNGETLSAGFTQNSHDIWVVAGCGIGPGSAASNTTQPPNKPTTLPPEEKPLRQPNYDLTRQLLADVTAAEQIKKSMTLEEVCSIMGDPQQDIGSGLLIPQWYLTGGEILTVSFVLDESGTWRVESTGITPAPDKITTEQALAIAQDRVRRYSLQRFTRICCDYELVIGDMSEYLTEGQKEKYYDQQYKILCCHNAAEVNAHIHSLLAPSAIRWYPDEVLFTDSHGDLYLITIPTDHAGYSNVRIAQYSPSRIVAVCDYGYDGEPETVTFVLYRGDAGFYVAHVLQD